MAEKKELAPIIKKIKKGGHGHHGGAWKVAYADFVTAMMAFFLLMWLLNSTEAVKLAGLAEYFAPTIGVKDQMGIGFRGGKGRIEKGIGAEKDTVTSIVFGAPAGTVIKNPVKMEELNDPDVEKVEISQDDQQKKTPEQMQEEIRQQIQKTPDAIGLDQNVTMRQTNEGIEIKVINKDNKPMFAFGSAKLEPEAEKVLENVAELVGTLSNRIAIIGHTSAKVYTKNQDYGNWELSADRANTARRFLLQHGVLKEQISKVLGRADQEPYDSQSPQSDLNDRVSIIVLNHAVDAFHKKSTPDAVFVDPDAAKKGILQNVNPNEKKPEPKVEKKPVEKKEGWDFQKFEGNNPADGVLGIAPGSKSDSRKSLEVPPAPPKVAPDGDSASPVPSMGL